jgi:hypothetical protein
VLTAEQRKNEQGRRATVQATPKLPCVRCIKSAAQTVILEQARRAWLRWQQAWT